NTSLRQRRGDRPTRGRKPRERPKIESQIMSGVKPLFGILLEAMADDPLEARRDVLVGQREIRRILLQDCRHRVGRRFAVKRALSGKHLVENRAKREYVRSGIG